jgi:hypothetical protein
MLLNDLPHEILISIFELAADEDIIFDKELPTAFSAYSRYLGGRTCQWTLITPQESLNLRQRRSYITKKVRLYIPMTMVRHDTIFAKAIILTCKLWQRIGSGLLFRCLFLEERSKMFAFRTKFDSEPVLGRWTRRIHVPRQISRSSVIDLVPLIRLCPNLEILIIEERICNTFDLMVDSLFTHCSKSLQTVHWIVPFQAFPKVIWALEFLPSLTSVYLEFYSPTREDYLVAASDSDGLLDLPNLVQLSLRRDVRELMNRACRWKMPSLKSFSLDCGYYVYDEPDIIQFLIHHGSKLTFLDIYSFHNNVTKILDLCPLLQTLTFNADSPLTTSHDEDSEENPDGTGYRLIHQNMTHIGLHGLQSAFNVRSVTTFDVSRRETNHRNFNSLTRHRLISRN